MSMRHLLTEVSSSCIHSCPNLDAVKTSFSQGVMDNWTQSSFHSGLLPPLPWSVIPSLEETWRKLNCGVQWGRCPVRMGCVMWSCSCATLGKLKMGRRSGMFRGWGWRKKGESRGIGLTVLAGSSPGTELIEWFTHSRGIGLEQLPQYPNMAWRDQECGHGSIYKTVVPMWRRQSGRSLEGF